MKTLQVTSQEFAQKQDALLDLAIRGTRVLISRNNEHFFVLTPIEAEYSDNERSMIFRPMRLRIYSRHSSKHNREMLQYVIQ